MKANYFSRKLILSVGPQQLSRHPQHSRIHGTAAIMAGITDIMAVDTAGVGCWRWSYRRRANRRRTRLSLLRPAGVLGAVRSMGSGTSGLPIDN